MKIVHNRGVLKERQSPLAHDINAPWIQRSRIASINYAGQGWEIISAHDQTRVVRDVIRSDRGIVELNDSRNRARLVSRPIVLRMYALDRSAEDQCTEPDQNNCGESGSSDHQLPKERFQRAPTRIVAQLEQRLFLDLADALARDLQQGPDVLERHRIGAIEPEVQAQNLGLALLQR
jgi:hypothetical protein